MHEAARSHGDRSHLGSGLREQRRCAQDGSWQTCRSQRSGRRCRTTSPCHRCADKRLRLGAPRGSRRAAGRLRLGAPQRRSRDILKCPFDACMVYPFPLYPCVPPAVLPGAVSCGVSHMRPSTGPAGSSPVRGIAPASLDRSCVEQSRSKCRYLWSALPEWSRTCHSPTSPSMTNHGLGGKSVSAAVPPGLPGSL